MGQKFNCHCLRQKQLLEVVPFSKATLWRKVKAGTFPKPVKLSEGITAWQVTDIEAWFAKVQAGA